MDLPVVLFSTPRSGSTWVQEYISVHNLRFNLQKILPYELFNPVFSTFTYNNKIINLNSYQTKLDFLKKNNISCKIHLCHVEDEKEINLYYNNFFKIKLLRKNLWDQFISEYIQVKLDWSHQLIIDNKYNISKSDIDNWINFYKKTISINIKTDVVWYYEDLSDKFLYNFFNCNVDKRYLNSTKNIIKRRNNYKQNITNYNFAKKEFIEYINKLNIF